jgi:hypothetical protein
MSDKDNVIDMVEAAQKKGKFSLAEAIKDRAFPEKSVDVYIDGKSAYELAEVVENLKSTDPESPEYAALNEQAEDLTKSILDSKLTFHMRGVGQGVVEEATEGANKLYPKAEEEGDPRWITWYLCYLVAANIVRVTDPDGNEDNSTFTVLDLIEIRNVVHIDAWGVLIDTMEKLSLATSYFEAVTDAGFLPKS